MVFMPRPSANAGSGSMTPPSRRRILPIGAISACDPDSTPPVTSLWPFRYLVQLCIDRSMPIDSTG